MPLNWEIEKYLCINSTQDTLKERASEGAGQGLVVCAEQQTGGRGRHGNQWASPKGNLYTTFLLKPNCPANVAGQYSFIVAVALSSAIDAYMNDGHDKKLKWPNDILIDGKKCAGILLESNISTEGIITELYVGLGVNILSTPEDRIGLSDVSENTPDVDSFLNMFLEKMNELLSQYDELGFAPIREKWITQAYKLKEEIRVRLPHETLYGVFEGLDEDGTLLLRLDNKRLERITAGEVYF